MLSHFKHDTISMRNPVNFRKKEKAEEVKIYHLPTLIWYFISSCYTMIK